MTDLFTPAAGDAGTDLDKPIWGAAAIGRAINRTTRQAFRLLETGEVPARKIGGRWATTPRQLRETFGGKAAAISPNPNRPGKALS